MLGTPKHLGRWLAIAVAVGLGCSGEAWAAKPVKPPPDDPVTYTLVELSDNEGNVYDINQLDGGVEVGTGVALHLVPSPDEDRHRPSRVEATGGHETVAAVVALAADDQYRRRIVSRGVVVRAAAAVIPRPASSTCRRRRVAARGSSFRVRRPTTAVSRKI